MSPDLSAMSPVWTHSFDGVAVSGSGCRLTMGDGRTFLDFTSGIGVNSTGHSHPAVVEAVREQAGRLLFSQINCQRNDRLVELSLLLREVCPPGLDRVFLANSGAEAVEASVKLAKHATGRPHVVVMQGSFHGRTHLAMAMTTSKTVYRVGYAPLPAGVHVAPYPYALALGMSEEQACRFALDQLEVVLHTQTDPCETACVVVEPILGEGGYVVPPEGYLAGVRAICDAHGILMVVDEIQSGFCRTGSWFAHEHDGIRPDIMTIAKGMGSGFPISGIVYRADLDAKWIKGSHGGTYGGGPLACAASIATIGVMRAERLEENARTQGERLRAGLEALRERFPILAQVRGRGLMVGVELMREGAPAAEVVGPLIGAAQEKGLLLLSCGTRKNVVRWIPPLIATAAEIEEGLELFTASLETLFRRLHPKSIALREEARSSLQDGVPMLWMSRWAGASPVFVKEASGAKFVDVDGIEYLDLCLGDTGSMTGHAPEPALRALNEQARRGISTMLPTRDAAVVGAELGRRFGLPLWQFTVSATDANRFALRTARLLSGRSKVLVFNGCYHGTVDESYIALDDTGTPGRRASSLGPPVDPLLTSRVVEWNDPDALEAALAQGDVAAVLAEPAMTNIGIILPDPGYLDFLRECTRRHGVYLILDETHTLCAGPGGCTARWGLQPDFVTLGKAIASGLPAGAYGTTREVAQAFAERLDPDDADVGGIGGTLAGNALGLAVMRATLEEVLTPAFHTRAEELQERFTRGVEGVIAEFSLPWIVKRLGNRSEYWFQEVAPRNGSEARRGIDHRLDRFMHLWALNRGILMTPFHNMALVSPELTEADIDHHTSVFRGAVEALLGRSPLQEA